MEYVIILEHLLGQYHTNLPLNFFVFLQTHPTENRLRKQCYCLTHCKPDTKIPIVKFVN